MSHVLALPTGTVLAGDYRLERVLGVGGFGITYLADEMALQRQVTIKEYFPTDFAARSDKLDAVPRSENSSKDYQWGLDRFIEEAQTLARFDHRNIVKVYRYFRANQTGYMVLHFEEGQSLKLWLKSLGRAPRQKELDQFIAPILDALEVIHNADYLHRDIAPDNIIIRKDGSPVLIDFGSARGDIAKQARTLSALVKPGYSPYEQYSETGHRQGPWTDIYALGATLYHAISGKRPPDAPSRVIKDEYLPAQTVALSSYRPSFLKAIDKALTTETDRRPQSIAAWRGGLLAPEPIPQRSGWLGRADQAKAPDLVNAVSPSKALADIVPPVPDAPGKQGGFLDFVDGLKRKDGAAAVEPAPVPPVAAAPTVPLPVPAAAAVPAKAAEVKPPAPVPKPVAPRAKAAAREAPPREPKTKKPPRPRAITGSGTWRPLLLRLSIGAALATGIVILQNRIPQFHVTGSTLPSSQSGDVLLLGQLAGHKGGTTGVAFTDDSRTVVTVGADSTLKLWSASSGSLLRTIDLEGGAATSLALTGRVAVTGHGDGRISVWDIDRGQRTANFKRNEASIWSVAFAGAPTRIIASAHDWSVSLWDTKSTSAPLHVFEGHENPAQAVAYSPAGSLIVSGSADKTVRLWNAQSLSAIRSYRGHKDFVTAVAIAPDGKRIVSGSLDGNIRFWSAGSSQLNRSLTRHKGRIGGLAFAPSGDLLASGGDDGTVRIWDTKRGRSLRVYGGGGPAVKSVSFAPDGKRIAAASDDGTVRLWAADVPTTDSDD